MSTPTTAMTIHSQGPRKMRLTSMSQGLGPDLLPVHSCDESTVHASPNEADLVTRSVHCPRNRCDPPLGARVFPAGSAVHVRGERADAPQVAVALGVVEAIAHDELVGDVVADVLHVHGHLQRLRLAQQR